MQDLNDKVTDGILTAAEWNEVPSELQNIIEDYGITLSGADLNQLGKAIKQAIANGTFYIDSGAANAYVLTAIDGQSVQAYTNGMEVNFIADNDSTGIAATINVAGLGNKDVKLVNGDNPDVADISGRTQLIFDTLADHFEVQLDDLNFENSITNGEFQVNQEQTQILGQAGGDVFVFDEWQIAAKAGGDLDITTETHPVGQADVPTQSPLFMRLLQNDVAAFEDQTTYRKEDVRTHAGKRTKVVFYLRSNTSSDYFFSARQDFGSGGSALTDVVEGVRTFAVDTLNIWERFEFTCTFPSISGKTIGTDNFILITIASPTGIVHQTDFDLVSLIPGSIAQPYPHKTDQEVLTEMQKFFYKVDNNIQMFNRSNDTAVRATNLFNPTRMRATPTITNLTVNFGTPAVVLVGDKVCVVRSTALAAGDSVQVTGADINARF